MYILGQVSKNVCPFGNEIDSFEPSLIRVTPRNGLLKCLDPAEKPTNLVICINRFGPSMLFLVYSKVNQSQSPVSHLVKNLKELSFT